DCPRSGRLVWATAGRAASDPGCLESLLRVPASARRRARLGGCRASVEHPRATGAVVRIAAAAASGRGVMRLDSLARTLADEFRVDAAELDRTAAFPTEHYARMRATGYLRAPVPEELGGMGCGLGDLARAQTELARGCASTALAVNMHLFQLGSIAE